MILVVDAETRTPPAAQIPRRRSPGAEGGLRQVGEEEERDGVEGLGGRRLLRIGVRNEAVDAKAASWKRTPPA